VGSECGFFKKRQWSADSTCAIIRLHYISRFLLGNGAEKKNKNFIFGG